ncbi:MAG: glycoside hydrolase family 130 protein [Candidatus Latescibacterota bacterium]|nr:MAG: glycoside hydrolase family 130 protein [Candidatus Latescibacterota bacterium]
MALRRSPKNPILTRDDIPDLPDGFTDVTSVFNPGAVLFENRYILLLRVQSRGRETQLVKAESDDGVDFRVADTHVEIRGIENQKDTLYHVYDPRITKIGEIYYVTLAIDTNSGCRMGLARTRDFDRFDFVGIASDPDTRNSVLFPERVGGWFVRLDRPNKELAPFGPTTGLEIQIAISEDLVTWEPRGTVLRGRPHHWDELIGSGPPPVKTREGWLHVYHGVATHFGSSNIYQAGIALLDLNDPSTIVARGRNCILEPRELYEMVGQVPNVVFPTGMIVKRYDDDGFAEMDSDVLLYYGAADTCVCLAASTVRELIDACHD